MALTPQGKTVGTRVWRRTAGGIVAILLCLPVPVGRVTSARAATITKICVSKGGLVLTTARSNNCARSESRFVWSGLSTGTVCIAANKTLKFAPLGTCPARTLLAVTKTRNGVLPACAKKSTRRILWLAARKCPGGYTRTSLLVPAKTTTTTPASTTTIPISSSDGPTTTRPGATPVTTAPVGVTNETTTTAPPASTVAPGTTTTVQPTTTTVAPSSIVSFTAGATTINEGGSTTLSATYSGSDGVIDNMVGSLASGNSIAISPTVTTTYKLTVSNGAGHSVFQYVTINVNSLSITAQPVDTVSVMDSGDYLSVTASATGALSYQWQRNGSPIDGAVGSSYRANLDGNYRVVITSSMNGVTRSVTSMTVSFAMNTLSITSQPSDAIVAEGDTNTFSVSATASGSITYQWYLNDAAVDGATSRTFTSGTAGSHKVKVTSTVNGVAQWVNSNSASLDVNAVNITSQPTDAYVTTGGTTLLSVGVSSPGGTTIEYQWYKDGSAIVGSTGQGHNAGSGGAYKVRVTSSRGGTTSSRYSNVVTVTEVSPASISNFQPAASSVALGGSTTFTPVFSGESGTINPGNIPVNSGDTVTVTPAATTSYTLTVTNQAGSSVSFTSRIIVTKGTVAATANNSSVDRYSRSTSVKMSNGKVLVFGNYNSLTAITDVFDPATNSFTRAGDMLQGRGGAPGILLASGKVLAVGGVYHTGTAYASRQSTELFDPATQTWSSSGNLVTSRRSHFAVLLQNGKVLAGGGYTGAGTELASVEMYDPATGTWTAKNSMPAARAEVSATVLPNGNVLVIGGYNSTSGHLKTALVYDVAGNTWSTLSAQMNSPHSNEPAVVPLADGRVVIGGGWNGGDGVATIDIFDPATSTFAAAAGLPSFSFGRGGLTGHLLADGMVAFFGGSSGVGNLAKSIVLFDPTTNVMVTEVNTMRWWRYQHSSALLDDGRVVIIGGNSPNTSSADLYTE